MSSKTRIAIFVSGRGSNFDSIYESILSGQLNAEIVCLVADRPCLAVEKATTRQIPTFISKNESEVINHIKPMNLDFLILAGYKKIISATFIENFKRDSQLSKIINIHPSLLPAFPGLHSYAQAFNYGVKFTGVTIHFVVPDVDAGPICAQAVFSIEDCLNLEDVESRGLAIEHQLYPNTLKWIFSNQFSVKSRGSRFYVQPH
ncbi:MAG: phosphoribosylglycinamide formyltransferase [Pseudobdellovibrionaceae bacterium]